MVLRRWNNVCEKLHKGIGSCFYKWGCFVYNHPKSVIIVSLVISLGLSSGFLHFNIYGQSERLFYPQNSQLFKDLDRSEKYFNYYVQREEILIKYKNHRSILTRDIFQEALQIHKDLMSIPGFTEFCVKSSSNSCLMISPLEIFNFDTNQLNDIKQKLLNAFSNFTHLMNNGYSARVNFRQMFGNLDVNVSANWITANVLRIVYPVNFAKTRDDYERNSEWEGKMLSYLKKLKPLLDNQGMELIFSAVRSVDDAIEQNTKDNLLLIFGAVTSMVLFCAIAMTRIGSTVHSHFLLSLLGIMCVTLGIGAGFGLALWVGQPYVGFVGVLPFLVLGVGIDDMFIIINKIDHVKADGNEAAKQMGTAMKAIGLSVTMTTVTDLIAFVIGAVSIFPAIRIFCVYAFLSLFFAYMMIMTLFLGFLSYDMKRMQSNKIDCMPWKTTSKNSDAKVLLPSQNFKSITEKVMEKYGNILVKPTSKVLVLLLALLLVAVGCYGTSKTDLSFDYKIVGSNKINYVKWINTMETYFSIGYFPIDIVLDKPGVDYTSMETQRQFNMLDKICEDSPYLSKKTRNWYSTFYKWKQETGRTNSSFYPDLDKFLMLHNDFQSDIIFGAHKEILASRIHVITKYNLKWGFRKNAMLLLRSELSRKTSLPFYAVTFDFIYASHLAVIITSTLINLGICCAVILFVTLPYVINPVVSFLLLFTFVCFIVELLGVMFFWGLSLNSITMIVMVMAIGFTVDYSCHITHAYLASDKSSPEKRLVDAISDMGLSVLKGGLSTLVGVIVLSLSSSKLFILFFKMMFTIILLGLVHGMIILPVLLTIFCRTQTIEQTEHVVNGTVKANDENEVSTDAALLTKVTSL